LCQDEKGTKGRDEGDVILCPSFSADAIFNLLIINEIKIGDVILCPHLKGHYLLPPFTFPILF